MSKLTGEFTAPIAAEQSADDYLSSRLLCRIIAIEFTILSVPFATADSPQTIEIYRAEASSRTPASEKLKDNCQGATAESLSNVTKQINDILDKKYKSTDKATDKESADDYVLSLKKKAKKLGLRYSSGYDYTTKHEHWNSRNTTFEQSFTSTAAYAKKHGVTLTLATTTRRGFDYSPLPPVATTEQATFDSLENIVLGLGSLPYETSALLETDTINIADLPGSTAGESHREEHSNEITIDPTNGLSSDKFEPTVLFHEYWHKLDGLYCGPDASTWKDPVFAGLNPADIYVGEYWRNVDPNQPANLNTLENYESNIKHEVADASAFSRTAVCEVINDHNADAARTMVGSIYGAKNIVEDKSVIGASILDGDSDIYDPNKPILRAKAIELLARLQDYNEPLAQFVIYKTGLQHSGTTC